VAPDRPPLENRLRGALRGEAAEHPLRSDFAASVSDGLPERTPSGRDIPGLGSKWTVAAGIGLVVVVVALAAILARPLAVGPSPTGTAALGPVALQTQPPPGPNELCPAARIGGVLAPDPAYGLGVLSHDGAVHGVVWPNGYAARRDAGGIVLLDRSSQVVAHEGDEVVMSGVIHDDGVNYPCDNPDIQVVTAAASTSPPRSWLQLTSADTADAWWSPDSQWLLVASGVTNGTPDQQSIALRDRGGGLVRTMQGSGAEWIDDRTFLVLDRDPSAAVGAMVRTLVGSVDSPTLTPTGPPVVNGPGGFETNPVSNGHGAVAYALSGTVGAQSTFAVWTPTATSATLPGVPVAWSTDGTQLAVWHQTSSESSRQAQGWMEVLSWPSLRSVLQLKTEPTFPSGRQVQFDPSGSYLYVNGAFVDLGSGQTIGHIAADFDPENGAWDSADQFLVASRTGGDAGVFDVSGQQVATLGVTGDSFAASADGSLVVNWTMSEARPITLIRGTVVQERLTVPGTVQPPMMPAPDGSALVAGWAGGNGTEAFLLQP
jgi:hypothetical protein